MAQNEPEVRTVGASTEQTFQFVSGQLISGPPVKGAPYSAEAVNETIQTLADGNRIVQRTSAMQYRDTDGRERREETSAMGAIFITDPVAGVRYTLHPESKTAEKGPAGGDSTSRTDTAGGRSGRVELSGRGSCWTGSRSPCAEPVLLRHGGPSRHLVRRRQDRATRQHVHRRRPGPGNPHHHHHSRGRYRQRPAHRHRGRALVFARPANDRHDQAQRPQERRNQLPTEEHQPVQPAAYAVRASFRLHREAGAEDQARARMHLSNARSNRASGSRVPPVCFMARWEQVCAPV